MSAESDLDTHKEETRIWTSPRDIWNRNKSEGMKYSRFEEPHTIKVSIVSAPYCDKLVLYFVACSWCAVVEGQD